ncbi:MAG: SUMF1/EgtB/PvdO family nonheme iron enzyme [Bacteroidales bacterium]|nr:SUMF1/EgtB/PvdO family nonheme iron enzyme [Bacteroidales bacterium]
MKNFWKVLPFGALLMLVFPVFSQVEKLVFCEPDVFALKGVELKNAGLVTLRYEIPLYTLMMDDNYFASFCSPPDYEDGRVSFVLSDSIRGTVTFDSSFRPGVRYRIRFTNTSQTDHLIENLVPLGEGSDKVYISAEGKKEWPDYLCRSKLYRPGYGPVGVILPDNAWHLGFADMQINDTLSIVALARRTDRDRERTKLDRWAVTLQPEGWVEYTIWADIHTGDWHEGLKLMFQERWLYDLDTFDLAMFNREDLKWMNDAYIMLLQFAWDTKFYDWKSKKYNFYSSLSEVDSLTGGYDIFTLWPSWPRLGLDQRNQWDMYRDLPGGIRELRKQSDFAHAMGKKYFISYNPWDESGRKEEHLDGMEELLRQTDADGVVLDTRGASSYELQAAADNVKPGIIMYSEGMAVPRDMPGIVSGRVHDALVIPPPVNLNKFIKPDFAIFRVLQLADDRLHREIACAFFNGYGVEINTMRPGRPSWMKEEYGYLGRTTKILRENSRVFHNYNYFVLVPTLTDSIYVNRWNDGNKTLYTILSMKPAGFSGELFEVPQISDNQHCIDLWNHQEIEITGKEGKVFIPLELEPFNRSWVHTRREGVVGCIALLPAHLQVRLTADSLYISTPRNAGDRIVLTGENPSYKAKSVTLASESQAISYWDYFPETTKKIVIQLFDKDQLADERVVSVDNSIPHLISAGVKTPHVRKCPDGMVKIPKGTFRFYTARAPETLEPFIQLPDYSDTVQLDMNGFFMDRYPVTNKQWLIFLLATNYQPIDSTNYLEHWVNGQIPEGEEDFPVVFINHDDAAAYARWVSKRLPTEAEWQYAAQGTDSRKYPWGNELDSTRCNFNLNHPTPVTQFPLGASPFGVEDMVGNVWQMTNDIYTNGSYYFNVIRGGSYYQPDSSIWYVTGGPLPADHPEMLLMIGPGLDRNATVGFRLVKD